MYDINGKRTHLLASTYMDISVKVVKHDHSKKIEIIYFFFLYTYDVGL